MGQEIVALVRKAEAQGCLSFSELDTMVHRLELDQDRLSELCDELAARGVHLSEECGPPATAFRNDELAGATTDTTRLNYHGTPRHPLLTAAQEIQLAKRIEAGDRFARNQIISSNLRLVASIAKRYERRGVARLDLVQEGILGLMMAVDRFDWRRGFRLSTYATWWIHNSLRRAVEIQGRAIRIPSDVAQRERRLRQVEDELRAQLGRLPRDDEIMEAAGLSKRGLRALHHSRRTVVSLDDPGQADLPLLDLVAAEEEPFEETVELSFSHDSLRQALDTLPEPERRVLKLRYGIGGGEGDTLRAVGRKLNLSGERVRQIELRALQRLALRREIQALRVTA
jgi:RNA polymerase primary sigma factor